MMMCHILNKTSRVCVSAERGPSGIKVACHFPGIPPFGWTSKSEMGARTIDHPFPWWEMALRSSALPLQPPKALDIKDNLSLRKGYGLRFDRQEHFDGHVTLNFCWNQVLVNCKQSVLACALLMSATWRSIKMNSCAQIAHWLVSSCFASFLFIFLL